MPGKCDFKHGKGLFQWHDELCEYGKVFPNHIFYKVQKKRGGTTVIPYLNLIMSIENQMGSLKLTNVEITDAENSSIEIFLGRRMDSRLVKIKNLCST